MLMVTDTGSGEGYEKPEPGIKNAVCSNVYDLGVQQTNFGPKHQVSILWELDELDSDGARFWQVETYTASLNEKSKLRQVLEAWRGKKFTPEELQGFDLEKLLDVGATLSLVHNESKNGKTYVNVQSIMPPQKDIKPVMPRSFVPSFLKEKVFDWPGKTEAEKTETEFNDDIPFDEPTF